MFYKKYKKFFPIRGLPFAFGWDIYMKAFPSEDDFKLT
jgi:hypothetical protein